MWRLFTLANSKIWYFNGKYMSCTVVSVMRMHKLKRDFEWHEHIKLCHTRLYALAATLHKCALISNAIHCCMYVYIACAPWIYQEKVFQEFTRIACTTASKILFFPLSLLPYFFLVSSSFASYFTYRICYDGVFFIPFENFIWLSYMWETLVEWIERCTCTHTKNIMVFFCSSPYLVVAKECCFSIVLNRCS